jgi:23S rRNA pseudouridine1911/1915/1917 synthase
MKREDLFQVVFEDAELLIVNKPAGLVCHPTKTDEYSSLISRARLYLGEGSHPQLVNRLDRETSGVTVIALTSESARELRKTWESREVEKEYLAIVHGRVEKPGGIIDAPLGEDLTSKVAIKDCVREDGCEARTEYRVEAHLEQEVAAGHGEKGATELKAFSVLRVRPQTGRKHQIRIHLAHLGHPIVGDKIYGGDEDLYLALVEDRLTQEQRRRLILPHHALHASSIWFLWRGTNQYFEAEPEGWLSKWLNSGTLRRLMP